MLVIYHNSLQETTLIVITFDLNILFQMRFPLTKLGRMSRFEVQTKLCFYMYELAYFHIRCIVANDIQIVNLMSKQKLFITPYLFQIFIVLYITRQVYNLF